MKKQRPLRPRHALATNFLDALEPRLLLSSTLTPFVIVHPQITLAFSPHSVYPGQSASLKGAFKDKVKTDTHVVTINWGDGSSPTVFSLGPNVTQFLNVAHTFATAGTDTVSVTVTNQNAVSLAASVPFNVLYDDLLPSFTQDPKLDDAIVTGTTVTGSVPVTITNIGNGPSPAATVSIFLRSTTGGSDIPISVAAADIPSIKGALTKNGTTKYNTKTVNVSVSLPLTLAAGDYHLVAVISDDAAQASPAQLNNTSVDADFTLNTTPGHATISPTLTLPHFPTTFAAGTAPTGNITLSFTNSGNIPSIDGATYDVSLVLHPASGPDVPFYSKNNVIVPTLKPVTGKSSVTTSFLLQSAATSLFPPGTYTVLAILTPHSGTPGGTLTVTGPTLTVTSGITTSSLLKHGDTIKFTANTQLTGGDFLESGSFETNTHTTGSYTFNPSGLTLTYTGGQTDTLLFTFTGAQTFMDPTLDGNPTTVTFSTAPLTGKSPFATVTINASTTLNFATYS